MKRLIMFTDIHWGCKNNSLQHNQDCMEFIDWMIVQIKKSEIDGIVFLGDWFENRNSINTLTFNMSLDALRKLNSLEMPIYFITGNHDLYNRHNRDIHSVESFRELKNVIIIEEKLVDREMLFLPYLFKDEYSEVVNDVNRAKYVFGHLEFRNFYLTGTNSKSEHGYHHKLFNGPKYIFSGHYHKRQATDNVIYIGNPFGTNFADVMDYERGCCILDLQTDEIDFIDYDGPTYVKCKLTDILEEKIEIKKRARVKAIIDVELSYSEAQSIKKELIELYELRELSLEENMKEYNEVLEQSISELDELDLTIIEDTIKKLLTTSIPSNITNINPETLIHIYEEIR